MEAGLLDAVEEAQGLSGGLGGGGGVRLRPPHLKPAKGDPEWKPPPPSPPTPPGLDVSALPLAVLEASTAIFSNTTAAVLMALHRLHGRYRTAPSQQQTWDLLVSVSPTTLF